MRIPHGGNKVDSYSPTSSVMVQRLYRPDDKRWHRIEEERTFQEKGLNYQSCWYLVLSHYSELVSLGDCSASSDKT